MLFVYAWLTLTIWAFGELRWWWLRSRWRVRGLVPSQLRQSLGLPRTSADAAVRLMQHR